MRVDLATVGEAFEDLIFGRLPHLPAAGEEVKTSHFHATIGGGAIITAVAASRAGARCHVVSGLGELAARRLRRERISCTNLRRAGEPHAITAALSTPADRAFVTFNGVNDRLEPRFSRAARALDAHHVHFAFPPARMSRWVTIVRRLRAAGSSTSWDFGWHPALRTAPAFLDLAGAVDFLMLNAREAPLYAGVRSLNRAIAFWRERARVLILKLGAEGSRWVSRDIDIAAPPPRVKAVDTTGAGDAFNGGFLAALLQGATPRAALAAGNRMGALSIRAAGGLDGLPPSGARASRRKGVQ